MKVRANEPVTKDTDTHEYFYYLTQISQISRKGKSLRLAGRLGRVFSFSHAEFAENAEFCKLLRLAASGTWGILNCDL